MSRSESEEEGSEYESEYEDDDDYESVKMTQKQYVDYLSNINNGYHHLTDNLQSHRSKVARDGDIESVQSSLTRANSLYENSRKIGDSNYKNEITHLDSRLIMEIGEQLSIGVSNINLGVTEKGLDVEDFMRRFARYIKKYRGPVVDEDELFYQGDIHDVADLQEYNDSLNWSKIELLYMKHSLKVPTTDFMLGPLDVEFKKRRITRLENDYLKSGEATRPSLVNVEDITSNQEKDTYQSSIQCYKILQDKNDDVPINLFKFFINPKSFSQSIENLFYTSFLINHNKLLLFKDSNGIPMIKIPDTQSNAKLPTYIASSKEKDNKSHLIFKLEYNTWLELIKTYEIKTLYLGNR